MRWFGRRSEDDGARLALQWRNQGLAWAVLRDDTLLGSGLRSLDKELGKVLQDLVAEQELFGCNTTLVLGAGSYQLIQTPTPTAEQDRPSTLRGQVKDMLDYPVGDAALDAFDLPDDAFRGRQRMSYVVSTPKAPLQSVAQLVLDADLRLDRIEVPELVVNGLLAAQLSDGPGAGLVYVDSEHAWVSLHQGGSIYLIRGVEVTHEGLERAGAFDHRNMRDSLVLELQRSMDYYDSQLGKGAIRSLWLLPGAEWSEEVSTYLGDNLRVPVTKANAESLSLLSDYGPDAACFLVQAALRRPALASGAEEEAA